MKLIELSENLRCLLNQRSVILFSKSTMAASQLAKLDLWIATVQAQIDRLESTEAA